MFSTEQFKWAVKLIGLDFEIQYKPGKENTATNSLSRRDMYAAISILHVEDDDSWDGELQQDPKLQQLVQDLIVSPTSHAGYEFKKGRLLYKGKLVLPKGSNKIPLILAEFHDSPCGGHSGLFRTFKRVSRFFF